jgi:hypothetical protein
MQPEKALSQTRFRCFCRKGTTSLGLLLLGLSLSGCGNVLYTYRANGASSKIEEARQAGAEKTALYEYTLAQEHLSKAMSEAAEADYGDAAELAQAAEDYATLAVEKARRRMRATPKQESREEDESVPTSAAPESGNGKADGTGVQK